MEIVIENSGKVLIFGLHGRLDTSNYLEFEKKLLDAIVADTIILVDCSDLNYISSSGLRTLLLALKKAEVHGITLALCSLQPNIMDVFRISAFITIFTVFPSREKALAKLS